MNIFVQLLTFCQDLSLLDLLKFPGLPAKTRISSKLFFWANQSGKMSRSEDLDELRRVAGTSSAKWNEVGFEIKVKNGQLDDMPTKLTELSGVLRVSPVSPLWAGTEYWKKIRNSATVKYLGNARSVEAFVSKAGVTGAPSILEVTFGFKATVKASLVVNAFIRKFCEYMTTPITAVAAYGTIDLGQTMLFTKINSFNPHAADVQLHDFCVRFPRGASLLGRKIDKRHFGFILTPPTGAAIANRLGGTVHVLPACERLVLVTLPDLADPSLKSEDELIPWLIPRDDRTSWEGMVKQLRK